MISFSQAIRNPIGKGGRVLCQPARIALNARKCRISVNKQYSIKTSFRQVAVQSVPKLSASGDYNGPKELNPRQVADLETILKEKDACGVGFIVNLKNIASHKIIADALTGLRCMEHRGGCSADGISGDGAGVMTRIPWDVIKADIPDTNSQTCGVAMVFLPQDPSVANKAKAMFDKVVCEHGFKVVGWRDVPTDDSVVGRMSKANLPIIKQCIVESTNGATGDDLERDLYIARKMVERQGVIELPDHHEQNYICSMSNRTIVYKGMLNSSAVGIFYKDLVNPAYVTSFAIYHRRYSTNTNPKWPLAQPMRFLGHNGEINTLQGNLNWMASRQETLSHPVWKGNESDLFPLCNSAASDSANLDRAAEFLVNTGLTPQQAVMILVPEAYKNHPDLMARYPEAVDFYEYYEGLQEGWDGPALLIFSDGNKVGARLDRNGLRPARYWETSDGTVYVASEVGVFGDTIEKAGDIIVKGRLGPGQMVLADLENGEFYEHEQVTRQVATALPYKEYMTNCVRLSDIGGSKMQEEATMSAEQSLKLSAACGMGQEDASMVIESMAASGMEPTFCMGDTIPLPVLAETPHMLYSYFKQRFAQVTNPPIDPLREGLVMGLEMRLGAKPNLLSPDASSYKQILLDSPVIVENDVELIQQNPLLNNIEFKPSFTLGVAGSMMESVEKLCQDAEQAVRNGCDNIFISDKPDAQGMQLEQPPVPMLIAVGAVHQHLIKKGIRSKTSIVAVTAQCFSTHHVAVLIGYGAHAVCPYLGLEVTRSWWASKRTQNQMKLGKIPAISVRSAQRRYKRALQKGVLKILSKMGISLLSCYHGAQIFEVYGLGRDVIETAFTGSVSRIGGLSMNEVQAEAESFWVKGFPETPMKKLEDYGFINCKPKGEYHKNNQVMARLLHKAIGLGEKDEDKVQDSEAYKAYMDHFTASAVTTLRDCLELVSDKKPIDISEVESANQIMKRFCTGGMSLGAISRETHETIAIAMNRIGGKSNSGEGGEDPVRWQKLADVTPEGLSDTAPHLKGLANGDTATSRIKQVASGRFGVTPQFLVNAEQLEIKVAQGAKPGEGGQLPGKKVSPYIANLRRSKPGVTLISPPPHHDIYSIEDLAQLIYDLHQANKDAQVSVKLVAEAGIGTVASGVAKANADIIQVSGHDGGTGASPVSSIKHAGGPTEMGLAETHQSLVTNELRDDVVLRVDGGIRDGLDVVKMAAMGADEFGFGTIAMIATGCFMARVCHTNNCPVGVASQREDLRARFPGMPGDVVNFFYLVAEEVRQNLAQLGLKSMDELIGQAQMLKLRSDLSLSKTQNLDLSFLSTYAGETGKTSSQRLVAPARSNGPVIDDDLIADKEIMAAIEGEGTVERDLEICNLDRAALGRLAGVIAYKYGDRGFKGQVKLNLKGCAGQSFACWTVGGMDIKLEGEANDYVGKGMAGGVLTFIPPSASKFEPGTSSLVGNTCLYGATGGKVFVLGRAGERFCVRNSMADCVVEGVGDHCCEYMTGGCVVVLGSAGRNIAAGMTGGLAYFYNPKGDVDCKINGEIVSVQKVITQAGNDQLRGLIEEHVKRTGSAKGQSLLDDWENEIKNFIQLVPPSEASDPRTNPNVEPSEVQQGATVLTTA